MRFQFGVRVMPREVILDSQGRAVEKTLELHKMPDVEVRVGKWIQVSVDAPDKDQAQQLVHRMAKDFFHNPLLENYEVISQ